MNISKTPGWLNTLTFPLRVMPVTVHSQALALILNQVMRDAIKAGELDFLIGKCVGIDITDLGLSYRLGMQRDRIIGFGNNRSADACVAGNLREFVQLATRKVDADTLFFQRRLRMSGNTELGLYLKNFLDAFELPKNYQPLVKLMDKASNFHFPGFPK